MKSSEIALGPVEASRNELALAPVSAGSLPSERYLIRVTISRSTHDKLRHAQALLSHAMPAGDVAQVLDRALDALIAQLERRKFGATKRPRGPRDRRRDREPREQGGSREVQEPRAPQGTVPAVARVSAPRKRYISAPIRRAVWERDQGQCTFVSANGTRCKARQFLEFDHIEPVARGGRATVAEMRLRCRAHNQYEAERVFGAGFMSAKRDEARRHAIG
jgi:hypothetical protein